MINSALPTKISTILWDFDGVILDSTEAKSDAFFKLYLPFGTEFAERVREHHLQNGGMSRFEKIKLYHGQWLNIPATEELIAEWANKFSVLVLNQVLQSNPVAGLLELFNSNIGSLHHYIITGTPQEEIEFILAQKAWNKWFKEVMGSPTKKDVWVQKLVEAGTIDPAESIFVGDAMADYQAANSAKIHFVLREHSENLDLLISPNINRVKDLNELVSYIKPSIEVSHA